MKVKIKDILNCYKQTLYTCCIILVSIVVMQRQSLAQCNINTVNPSFEAPNLGCTACYADKTDASTPGWRTTEADHQIEYWTNNFNGGYGPVPAYDGNQFVELNANAVGGLYQDYNTPAPVIFSYSYAHRGRAGVDQMAVEAGPPGGPYTQLQVVSDGNTSWTAHSGTYSVPAGQTVTRFIFIAVATATHDNTVGNFLDAINFTASNGIISPDTSVACADNAIVIGRSSGIGTWTALATNPSPTTISAPTSTTTNITGFTARGNYKYLWTTFYCTSTFNVYINGLTPVITLSPIAPVCYSASAQTVKLPYTSQAYSIWYSINGWSGGSFANVVTANLLASPISITVPAGTAGGNYTANFTVVNGQCTSAVQSITVPINALPTITLGTMPTVCISPTAQTANLPYTATTGSPNKYSISGWSGGGFSNVTNATLTTSPISIAVPAGAAFGTYTAKLIVTNANSCTSIIYPISVTVTALPSITLSAISGACFSSTAQTVNLPYTATTGTPTTYSISGWSGGSFSNITNAALPSSPISIAVPASTAVGTYTANLTVSNGTCTSTVTPISVTVNPLPTISLSLIPAICFSSATQTANLPYTATTGTPTTYSISSWSGGGFSNVTNAALPTSPISIAVPASVASGTYTAKLTVQNANGCTSGVYTISLKINDQPTITLSSPTTSGCFSASAQIFPLPYTAQTLAIWYSISGWSGGSFANVNTAVLQPNSISIAVPAGTLAGTYTANLTVVNATCTSIVYPISVIVNTAAVPGTLPVTYCKNSTAVPLNATGTNLLWYTTAAGGVGSSTAPTPLTTTVGNTTFYVSQTPAACESPRASLVVTVNSTPTFSIHNPVAACSPSTVDITAAAVTAGSTAGQTLTYYTNAAATLSLATPSAVASSGTYYIKGVIATGCSDTGAIVVTINPKPTLTITNPAAVCFPSTVNITAAAVTSGSTGGQTFSYYTNAAATASLATPSAVAASGTYYIKGVTATGCSDTAAVVVTVNAKPTLTITNPAAVCFPSTVNITAAAVTAGSTGGQTFSYYTNAAATASLATPSAVTASGTYYIKGVTASGCSDTAAVVVTVNAKPTLTITNPAAVCFPSTVNITAASVTAGSTGGQTFSYYTNAAATASLATPSAVTASGTYYIKGVTASGCSDTAAVVVTVNAKPTLTITNPAAVCSPSTVNITAASVTAGSTGGQTFSYYTNAAATASLATPSAVTASGTYYIKGVTASGCSDTAAVVVTVNAKPTLTITNPAVVCSPSTVNITAAAVTSGSTGGQTFSYYTNAAATTSLLTPTAVTASGTYYIKGVTASGCSDTAAVVVTVNPKPTLTITNPAAVCSPSTVNITAAAVTSGSTGGQTFSYYTNAAATASLATPTAVTASGTYYIKGVTATGCSDTAAVVVTVNAKPTLTITNPAAVCFPSTVNITAAAVTSGSTGGQTFSYYTDAAATTSLATPTAVTASGTYYIKGVTASGCSDTAAVAVTVNAKPTLTITNPAAVCSPSTVNITAAAVTAGSTGGQTFSYYTNAAATTPLATPTAVTASGTYYIKGVTASGCSDTAAVVVTVNAKPTLTITNPAAVCSPSTVNITAAAVTAGSTGGQTFSYYTNAAATTPLATPTAVTASGTYYIKGVTASGCSDTAAVVVTVNAKPTLTITNPAAVCSPSTVNITAAAVTAGSTGGQTFSYYTNAAATTSLATPTAVTTSGTYYIKGVTASGCSDTAAVVVTVNAKPTLTITNPAAVCSPSTVNITAAAVTAGSTGGQTFSYYTNAAATTSLATPTAVTASGTYYIKGVTASGCSDTAAVVVTVNAKPTLTITNPVAVCSPSTVNITAASVTSGSTGGQTFSYYTNAAATASLLTPTAVTASGTYYIKGVTASGCSDTAAVVVTVNAEPTLTITNPAAVCFPSTVDITAAAVTSGSTGGQTFSYYTDAAATSSLLTPNAVTASGTYYIKGAIATGCSDTAAVVVTVNAKPTLTITNPAAVCSPSTVNITAAAVTSGSTGGQIFSYYTDAAATSSLLTPTAVTPSGTYYIKGVTASGCSDTAAVVVTVNAKPTLTITNPAAVCFPSTVDITAAAVTSGSTGGQTFSYYTNAAATSSLLTPTAVTASGTYYIKGVIATGCSDTAAVVVTVNAKPTLTITNPAAVCSPSTVNITAAAVTSGSTGGQTFSYYTDAAATSSLLTPTAVTASGTYYIKGVTASGCSDTAAVVVTVNAKPTLTITNPAAVCSPSTVNITAASVTSGSTGGQTFSYYTNAAATTSLLTPTAVTASGTYYIKGVTASGCSDTAAVVVTVNAKPTLTITNPAAVCFPSTVDITAAAVTSGSTGGQTFSYYTDAAATSSLLTPTAVTASGTYYIKGVIATGCSDTAAVVVTVNAKPTLTITNPAAVCSPSTVNITAAAVTSGSTGGQTFSYYTDVAATSSLLTPTAVTTSGTYYIKGVTASGCSDTAAVVVTVNAKPTLTITNPAAVCFPSTVNITVAAVTSGSTGGQTFSYYTNAAATASLATPSAVTASGTYYIKGVTASGCSDTAAVVVTVNAKPTLTITNPAAVCSPSTVNITAAAVTSGSTGGQTFSYYTDAAATSSLLTPIAVTASGTYYIKGVTASGCSDTSAVVVTVNAKPTLTITNPAAVCFPSTVDITAAAVTSGSTGGQTFSYYINAAATASLAMPTAVTASGTYYIKGVTATDCSDTAAVVVTVNAKPTLTITNPAAVCSPSTVNITAASVTSGSTGGQTFSYYTNAAATTSLLTPTAVTASGTYYIKGVTASGCSDTAAVVVTVNAKPTLTITNPAAVCFPSTVDITAAAVTSGSTGGQTFSYYTDAAATSSLLTPTAVTASGTYYIKGVIATGCSDTAAVVVTVNTQATLTITDPAAECFPSTVDITAAAVTSGSTGGQTFSYYSDAAATSPLATPTAVASSGTYYITGITATGCRDTAAVVVTINPTPTVNSASTADICNNTAQAYTITSATAGAAFSWTRAAVAGISNVAGSGATASITETLVDTTTAPVVVSYTITPSTAAGCVGTPFTYSVTVDPTPTVNSASTADICNNTAQAYTITSATAGATFSWTRAAVAGISNVAGSGATASITETLVDTTTAPVVVSYTITPSTAAGCVGTPFTYSVTVDPTPTVNSASTADICNNTAQAYTITSATAGATFSWTRAAVAGISNVAGSGATASITETLVDTTTAPVVVSYTITPSTAAGCVGTPFTYSVTVDPTPTVNSASTADICNNTAQAYTITSATAGATFSWTRAAVAGISNVAGSGATASITEILVDTTTAPVVVSYTITPSTAAGCVGTPFTYSVTVDPTPTVNSASTADICNNTAQAYTITSATAGATFSWTRAAVAGISNVAGSGATASITETLVDTTTAPVVVSYTIIPSTAAGCVGTPFTYSVTVDPTPTVNSASTADICNNTAQAYTITSATAGATFSWTRAAVAGISNVAGSGATASITETLVDTTTAPVVVSYTITPSTAAGCVGTPFTYSVTVDPTPTVNSASTADICNNTAQAYTITSATAGATFSWTRAAVIGISNAAGSGATASITETLVDTTTAPVVVSYTITPSTAAGCVGTPFTYSVTVDPTPTVNSASTADICNNTAQAYTITSATAGATFSWIRAAVAGISNVAGSGATASITETLVDTTTAPVVVSYTITPSTAAGCVGTPFTYSVTVDPTPTVNSASTADICNNTAQAYTITSATAGATFSWTRAAVAGISNVAGSGATASITETLVDTTTAPVVVSYTITPSTAAGCVGTPFTYSVTVDPTPTVNSASTADICNNTAQAYTITSATAGATFSWTRAAVAGISNVAGSGATASITETLVNITSAPIAVPYTIVSSTIKGCVGTTFTYTVTVNPTPIVNSATTGVICSGTAQAYTITSTVPGTTFSWTRPVVAGISNGANTVISPLINEVLNNTGAIPINVTYSIVPTSPDGCPGPLFTYTVTVNPTPAIPVVTSPTLCQVVGSVNFGSYVTGSNLLWYTTTAAGIGTSIAPSVNTNVPGTTIYYVSQTIISPTGNCEGPRAKISVTIIPAANPSVGINESNSAVCRGVYESSALVTFTAKSTNVGATPPLYQWSVNGAMVYSSSNSTYSTDSLPLGNNTITCTVIVQSVGCFSAPSATSNTVNVQVYQNPKIISLSALPRIINEGATAQLTANVIPVGTNVEWSASPDIDGFVSTITNPTVTPTVTTVYTLTVPPSGGAGVCPEVSDTVSITVYSKNFFMPNAFTPNGDGIDDVFRIPPSVSFALTDFAIYDRWGIKVFETTDITKGWDGFYRSLPSDIATYVYVITGTDLSGKVYHKGTVVLLR